MSLLNRFLLSCFVLLPVLPGARGDIDLPSPPPPQPEAVTAKVYVGESVEIPLNGRSRGGGVLQFLIRRPPVMGSLSEIVPLTRTSATVTYTHNARTGPGVERFRYAVKASGTGVSTPAEVIIQVAERPPRFVAPAVIEFPRVAVGASVRRVFEVRNDGGSRVDGVLSVPPPWKIANGTGRYSLGPGESETITLTFRPAKPIHYSETASFSQPEGWEMGLSGQGYDPIEVVPREIRLEGDGRSEERQASFILRNVSDENRTLTLLAPAQVLVPAEVVVPAGQEVSVQARTKPGALSALTGRLLVAGTDTRLDVPLRVMAAPSRVTADVGNMDLGTVPAGRFVRRKIVLTNNGGSEAHLTVELPKSIIIQPEPSYEQLTAGASREFELAFAQPEAGEFQEEIVIAAEAQRLVIPVKARVTEDPRTRTAAGEAAAPEPTPLRLADIPPVEQIGVTRQDFTQVDLVWKRTSPDAVRYVVTLRKVEFGPRGDPYFRYVPLDQVKPRFVRDEVRATLGGLHPGEHATLFITGFDGEGSPSPMSPPFVVSSKPKPPLVIPWGWLAVLGIGAFAALIVRERRRLRRESDSDVRRLDHLQ